MAIEEVRCSIKGGGSLLVLIFSQEFSIEIPDKEADSILSSMLFYLKAGFGMSILVLILLQSTKQ